MPRLLPAALLFAALLSASTAAAAQAAAPRKPGWWVPSGGSGWVAFDPTDEGHVVIPILLNGAPARALVDTGFENMVVTKRYADAHRLALKYWNTPLSVGGRTPFYLADGISMAIGDVHTTSPSTFVVADLDRVSAMMTTPVDVVIGLDLLSQMGWEIDEDAHRFRLMPSGALTFSHPAAVRRGPEDARLVTDIAIGRTPAIATMIDTGAQSALTVTPAVAMAAGARIVTDFGGAGIGGSVVTQVADARQVTVAGEQVDAVVEVAPPDAGITQVGLPAVIGMELLGRYDIRVDPPRGLIQLDPRTPPPPPVPKSTAGVQGPLVARRIEIVHVMLNSPAAAAGLKAGDAICGVDDRTAAEAFADHWGRAAPGTRYAVHLCDGRTVPLVTRAFY